MCRRNLTTRRIETVMVRKRITYAFSEFARGRFQARGRKMVDIQPMLNQMTADEIAVIWGLDFDRIWFHANLEPGTHACRAFAEIKARFGSTFMADGGGRLRQRLRATDCRGKLWWEFPKGRARTHHETDMTCAIREFGEETGVTPRGFTVAPSIHRTEVFTHMGVTYTHIYFAALANAGVRLELRPGRCRQMFEVCDLQWFDIEQIRVVDDTGRLARLATPMFRAVKRLITGKRPQGVPE